MKYYQTEEFKKLNRKWKSKLRKDGFKDIEISEDELVRYSFHLTQAYLSGTYDYYVRADEFLSSHRFQSRLDKFIWKHHSEGKSCRQISKLLSEHPTYPALNKSSVHERIKNMEALMLKRAG